MPNTPHPMDVLYQSMTPTHMVPVRGEFEPLSEPGQRFLVAKDGLWMEVKTPWLYLCYPLAQQTAVDIPCGALEPSIDFHYGSPPVYLLQRFQHASKDANQHPISAWISWNELTGFRYYELQRDTAADDVAFTDPVLGEGETVAFVLTSRGVGSVSATDNDQIRQQSGGVYGRIVRPL
ncbi:PRTRC system protein A [Undibacterium arcticum]